MNSAGNQNEIEVNKYVYVCCSCGVAYALC